MFTWLLDVIGACTLICPMVLTSYTTESIVQKEGEHRSRSESCQSSSEKTVDDGNNGSVKNNFSRMRAKSDGRGKDIDRIALVRLTKHSYYS